MTLIKSISGIRGTIGGKKGDNFTPYDIVECTAAYAQIVLDRNPQPLIVVGRDGRMTGDLVNEFVVNTLISMGIDVIDLGLSTTPSVEMAVKFEKADAGIILTASHNPREWNALKFLDKNGEFISPETGLKVLKYIEEDRAVFKRVDQLGERSFKDDSISRHIQAILQLPFINIQKIRQKKFHVVVDCINSTGAISVPPLLDALGCAYTLINERIHGDFAHNPEPLPEHLSELSQTVLEMKAQLGIAVDPDVDRLAFVMEDGKMFGEEYTLVACADHILGINPGPTVSNLSSTRALRDLTIAKGQQYYAAKVGEVNVVAKMKETGAVIGGEGNGGVILSELHYGRDALLGIGLILSLLAERNCSLMELKSGYPAYEMSKNKVVLDGMIKPEVIIDLIAKNYAQFDVDLQDGLKIDFPDSWVQIRKSNTEPILRIYAEARTLKDAKELTEEIKRMIRDIITGL
jgi:phosphomannomutase